ncbi:MAG: PD40 domain-containing protein [Magnetococcales bacterium]|nr:PD40 domain-containing protein [Magnetococcales bacterium]
MEMPRLLDGLLRMFRRLRGIERHGLRRWSSVGGGLLALEPRMMFDAAGFSDALALQFQEGDGEPTSKPPDLKTQDSSRTFATDGIAITLPAMTLGDEGHGQLVEARLEFIGPHDAMADKLDYSDNTSMIGRWDDGVLTLSPREGQPLAAAEFQTALNAVRYLYRHTGSESSLTLEDRTLRVTVTDADDRDATLILTLKQDSAIAARTGLDFAPTQQAWGDAVLLPDRYFVKDPKLEQTDPASMLTEVGHLVANILGNRVDDPDIEEDNDPENKVRYQGMAIVARDDANGRWFHATDGGSHWREITEVSPESALLLTATTEDRIRFVPNPGFIGETSIEFRAWDVRATDEMISGTMGVDTLDNGGTTPFSSEIARWTASIVPGGTVTLANELVSTGFDSSAIRLIPGNADNQESSLSDDGRFLVFSSDATNLVADDRNGFRDVFLRDNQTGEIRKISTPATGQANGPSDDPVISGDGSTVVFVSAAANLVSGDNNFRADVFRFSLADNRLDRVSVRSDGIEGNDASFAPDVSAAGDRIVFISRATNLSAGDDNRVQDLFLRDATLKTTVRLSVAMDLGSANGASFDPAISADGQWVVFASDASNLALLDHNGVTDIFLVSAQGGTTAQRLQGTAPADGPSRTPDISADGRLIVFASHATNLSENDVNEAGDVFLYQRDQTGPCRILSLDRQGNGANGDSFDPVISADGRFVVFLSQATDLDNPGIITVDSNEAVDLFHHSVETGQTVRLSRNASGAGSNGAEMMRPGISGDGHLVSHVSTGGNLVDDALVATVVHHLFLTEVNISPRLDLERIPSEHIIGTGELERGLTIADVLRGGLIDVNSDDDRGIAITRTGGNGSWQFSTDNGANWSELAHASDADSWMESAATLLMDDGRTRLRFVPDTLSSRSDATLVFHPWDGTWGRNGQGGITLEFIGGATAIGQQSHTIVWRIQDPLTPGPVPPDPDRFQDPPSTTTLSGTKGSPTSTQSSSLVSSTLVSAPRREWTRALQSHRPDIVRPTNLEFSFSGIQGVPAPGAISSRTTISLFPGNESSMINLPSPSLATFFRDSGGLPWNRILSFDPLLEETKHQGSIPLSAAPPANGSTPVTAAPPTQEGGDTLEQNLFDPTKTSVPSATETREPSSEPVSFGERSSLPLSGRPGFSRQISAMMATIAVQG